MNKIAPVYDINMMEKKLQIVLRLTFVWYSAVLTFRVFNRLRLSESQQNYMQTLNRMPGPSLWLWWYDSSKELCHGQCHCFLNIGTVYTKYQLNHKNCSHTYVHVKCNSNRLVKILWIEDFLDVLHLKSFHKMKHWPLE